MICLDSPLETHGGGNEDAAAATARIPLVISFIVPAHNEEALIGRTLSALHESARALGEPYKIVVANDASTDRTEAIALEHGARVVGVNRRQIAATGNAGARAATGEMFIFVDADTVVTARVLRAALRALRAGAVGGGCSVRLDGRLPLYAIVLMRVLPPILHAFGLAAAAGFSPLARRSRICIRPLSTMTTANAGGVTPAGAANFSDSGNA